MIPHGPLRSMAVPAPSVPLVSAPLAFRMLNVSIVMCVLLSFLGLGRGDAAKARRAPRVPDDEPEVPLNPRPEYGLRLQFAEVTDADRAVLNPPGRFRF